MLEQTGEICVCSSLLRARATIKYTHKALTMFKELFIPMGKENPHQQISKVVRGEGRVADGQ